MGQYFGGPIKTKKNNDLSKQNPSNNLSSDRTYHRTGWGGTDSKKESPMLDWVGGSSFAEHRIR